MKAWMGEYGRLSMMVLLGTALIFLLQGFILTQLKDKIVLKEAPQKGEKNWQEYGSCPELYGLEKDGKALALKMSADTRLDPLHTGELTKVRALDDKDGDITDCIEVYVVRKKEGKEEKERVFETIELSEKEKQYILSYEVSNSSGFWAKKRISILVDKKGGKI